MIEAHHAILFKVVTNMYKYKKLIKDMKNCFLTEKSVYNDCRPCL